MQTIGLTTSTQVEVISAYTATNQTISAVAAEPGWYVIGAFFLSIDVEDAQLEAIGAVSDPSLVMNVRLFDMTDGEPVSGAQVSLSSMLDTRVLSGLFSLSGQRTYQMQAETIGGSGGTLFGTLKAATLLQE